MPIERVGRYRVLECLGAGGMGQVFRCVEDATNQLFAIKFLKVEHAGTNEMVQRFEREIEALKALKHPHIVQLHDDGEDGGRRYYVMSLLSQGSLADLLERHERLPLPYALRAARQIATALAFAHRHGCVHRDVKPGNVRFDLSGNAMLIDFGLAKKFDADRTAITRDGTMLGTLSYMAPEQVRGEASTPLSDVYQLGVVLYEMLTGKLPYAGADLLRTLGDGPRPQPAPPSKHAPSVTPPVDAAVASMLATEPARRPQSAEEAERLLADCGATMQGSGVFRMTRPTTLSRAGAPRVVRPALDPRQAAWGALATVARSQPVRTALTSCAVATLVIVLGLRCELPTARPPQVVSCDLTQALEASDLVLTASEPCHAFVELATAGQHPSVMFNRKPGTRIAFRGLPVIPGRVYQARVWLSRDPSFPADGSPPRVLRTFRVPSAEPPLPAPTMAQARVASIGAVAVAPPTSSAQEAAALLKEVRPPDPQLTFNARP